MDPFSVVCGVAGLIGLAQVVVKEGYNYISTAKDTRDDIRNLFNEVAGLSGVLVALGPVVDDLGNAGYSAGITKYQQISDCEDILQHLKTLLRKINPTPSINKNPPQNNSVSGVKDTHKAKKKLTEIKESVKNAVKIAKWPLSKDETIELIKRLERYKATFTLTLSADSASKLMEVLDEVNETNHHLISIRSEQDRVAEEKIEEDRMTKLRWLFPGDTDEKHTDTRQKRQEGTGSWFFDTKEFKLWLDKPSWLFCHGKAGAGKTVLTSAVLDHIAGKSLDTGGNFGLAHIYCGFKDRDSQTPIKILASILRQLGFQKSELPPEIESLYSEFKKSGKTPSFQELFQAIVSLAGSFSCTWLFFDALDECDETTLRVLLSCIKDLMKTNIKGFVTSRSHVSEIRSTFEEAITIELSAHNEDIQMFVRSRLSTRSLSTTLAEEIVSRILEKADGIFLLVAFQVEFIIGKKSPRDIKKCLSRLPTGLDDIYKNILHKIMLGDEDNRDLALNALSWISHATRALHPKELCMALAIGENDTAIEDEDLLGESDLVDVCGGLVIIDKESKTVRFVHYTVQEYLDKTDEILRGAPAHARMAKTCLAYLSLDIFDERPAEPITVGFLWGRVNKNAFYQYSACNWGYHTKSSGEEKSVLDMICKFSKTGNRTESALNVFFLQDSSFIYQNRIFNTRNTFLVAAIVGLPRLTQALLELRHLDADIKDMNKIINFDWDTGRTPLSQAAEHGHLEVAQILVDRDDVEADSKNSSGKTPLSYAAMNGRLEVVQLLVDRDDVVADSKDSHRQTPLSYAAMKGHLEVVQLLVGRDDVEADLKNSFGLTPLSLAAMDGHLEVVQLLVGRDDVVADSKDSHSRTPLSLAAIYGHLEVVQLLVGRDDVVADSKDSGLTPLSYAALNGHLKVARLLVGRDDVEADSKVRDGKTPLFYAAMHGHLEVVQLLVGRDDVVADSKDSHSRTPLSLAAIYGHLEVVQLLVSRDDVDANSKDDNGDTPLSWAEYYRHHAIAELLRSKAKPEAEKSKEPGIDLASRPRVSSNGLGWLSDK